MNEIVVNVASLLVALLLLFSGTFPVRADAGDPTTPDQSITQEVPAPVVSNPAPVQPLANQLPIITVWYEASLRFGELGNPQSQVNILGNVRDPDGAIKSLTYRLNTTGPTVTIPIGPNATRLVNQGDFNAALDITALQKGTNTLLLTATDNSGGVQTRTVKFSYTPGVTPTLPYFARWSSASTIQDEGQVVDGQWQLVPDGVRPTQFGYDRLIALGDVSWSDYEVLVPVTVQKFYPVSTNDPGGVGIIARWQGHAGSPPLPDDWTKIGAYGYYSNREKGLDLRFNGTTLFTQKYNFSFGTTYLFKLRVETVSTGSNTTGGRYSFKIWVKGQPEPSWNSPQFANVVNRVDTAGDMQRGSVLLVAHRVDATFGDASICPLNLTYPLTVNVVGSGSVISSAPGKTRFQCGEGVTLTAVPDPNWVFVGWSGGASGTDPSVSLNVIQPMTITATFRSAQPINYDNSLYLPNISN